MIGRGEGVVREVEVGGALLDTNDRAADEGCQRGTRNFEAAQLGDGQFAVGGRQLRQNGLLIVVEFRESRAFHKHGIADGAPGIAGLGGGFAGDPFFAQHACEQTYGCTGLAAERCIADGFAWFERIQNGILDVLLFWT